MTPSDWDFSSRNHWEDFPPHTLTPHMQGWTKTQLIVVPVSKKQFSIDWLFCSPTSPLVSVSLSLSVCASRSCAYLHEWKMEWKSKRIIRLHYFDCFLFRLCLLSSLRCERGRRARCDCTRGWIGRGMSCDDVCTFMRVCVRVSRPPAVYWDCVSSGA